MVYLVKAVNSMKGKEGDVVAMVSTSNKALIPHILNLDVSLDIKLKDYRVVKELPGVIIENKTSVVILSQSEKEQNVDEPQDEKV